MVFERFSDCSLAIRVSVMSEFASVPSVLFKRVFGQRFLVIWAFVGDERPSKWRSSKAIVRFIPAAILHPNLF